MKIPILESHKADPKDVIGHFDGETGVIEFIAGKEISREMLFAVFGDIAVQILEQTQDGRLKKIKVVEWSVKTNIKPGQKAH
jgi:hypothetical protein